MDEAFSDRIVSAEGIDGALGLAVGTLRLLRDESAAFRVEQNQVADEQKASLVDWSSRLARDLRDVAAGPRDINSEDVLRVVDKTQPPTDVPALHVLRHLVLGIDEAFGAHFYALCVEYYRRRVGPLDTFDARFAARLLSGDPVPVSYERRMEVRGNRRSTSGSLIYEQLPYRVPHLTIAPEVPIGSEMVIDFRLADAWGQQLTATIATCHPTTSLREFNYRQFPVTPIDEPTTIELAKKQLDEAASQGAHVVLFPELVSTPTIRAELLEYWLSQGPKGAAVLLPGTEHVHHADERLNIAMMLTIRDVQDGSATALVPEYVHKKFRAATDGDGVLVEDLTPQPVVLRLHVTPSLKVAVLICRDFLEPAALHLVRTLEVDVLIVPAMTSQMDAFWGECEPLVRNVLTEVYIPNSLRCSVDGSGSAGILALPEEERPLRSLGGAARRPGVAVVDRQADSPVKWLETAVS